MNKQDQGRAKGCDLWSVKIWKGDITYSYVSTSYASSQKVLIQPYNIRCLFVSWFVHPTWWSSEHIAVTRIRFLQAEIHNPIDYPVISSPIYFRPNTMTRLMVTPQIATVSRALRNWSPFSRGCYYEHEKDLQFFSVYSQQNCEIECRANRTLKHCGCAAHYDPSKSLKPEESLV